jgi:hypothetical protein
MKNRKLVNYVKNKNNKLFEHKVGNFEIFIKDPLPENVLVKDVFSEVQYLVPDHILKLVDTVYIGEFDYFRERRVNAMYMDGALYLTNLQDNNEDMKDDVIHELAHAVEDKYNDFIYDDGEIKNEYFAKLRKLKNYLAFEGYNIRDINFFNTEYDEKFDKFLLDEVGYDKLASHTKDLFLAPYSISSLREYFARGFEEYFLGNTSYLLQVCPYLFKKVSFLAKNDLESKKYEI